MSAQHTPGPWELIHFGGPQIGHKATGEAVCTMWGDENDPADQFHANARLIAAAPELYAHLEWAAEVLGHMIGGSAQLDAMNAALAKARGEA